MRTGRELLAELDERVKSGKAREEAAIELENALHDVLYEFGLTRVADRHWIIGTLAERLGLGGYLGGFLGRSRTRSELWRPSRRSKRS